MAFLIFFTSKKQNYKHISGAVLLRPKKASKIAVKMDFFADTPSTALAKT